MPHAPAHSSVAPDGRETRTRRLFRHGSGGPSSGCRSFYVGEVCVYGPSHVVRDLSPGRWCGFVLSWRTDESSSYHCFEILVRLAVSAPVLRAAPLPETHVTTSMSSPSRPAVFLPTAAASAFDYDSVARCLSLCTLTLSVCARSGCFRTTFTRHNVTTPEFRAGRYASHGDRRGRRHALPWWCSRPNAPQASRRRYACHFTRECSSQACVRRHTQFALTRLDVGTCGSPGRSSTAP